MGWLASPADRAALISHCIKEKGAAPSTKKPVSIIMDGNATFRGYASAVKFPMSAVAIVRRVLSQIDNSGKKTVAVMFDDSSKMMPQRGELHKKRYKNTKPVSDADAQLATTAAGVSIMEPISFPSLFATSVGKAHAYRLLGRATYVELCRCYEEKNILSFIVSMPDGTVCSHGSHNFDAPSASNWGEADQKCYEMVQTNGADGQYPVVFSIDTDMILQVRTTCFCAQRVIVVWPAKKVPSAGFEPARELWYPAGLKPASLDQLGQKGAQYSMPFPPAPLGFVLTLGRAATNCGFADTGPVARATCAVVAAEELYYFGPRPCAENRGRPFHAAFRGVFLHGRVWVRLQLAN